MLEVEEEPAPTAHMALNLNTAALKLTNQRAPEVNRNVNIVNAFCGGNQFTTAKAETAAESPNNYCRCCKAALRILYENLFRPSGMKGKKG